MGRSEEAIGVAPKVREREEREEQERVALTVARFLRCYATFEAIAGDDTRQEPVTFAEVDGFVEGQLFELKEECHWLFRAREGVDREGASPAALFDILVGALFHQAMKVKESIYEVERYGPKYEALRAASKQADAPQRAQMFLREGERIIARARRSVKEDMKDARELFKEAAIVLRYLLAENRDNPLLLRALFDNQELVETVCKRKPLERLLGDMFDGHPAAGYLLAAEHLFEGGWYDRARELCKRARECDPKNKAAAQLLAKINAAVHTNLG